MARTSEFSKAEVTIGRRPTNDIILPSDGVSGSHARILVTGRTPTLVDLGSTNGTFVGSERVLGPRPVGPHEEVLIGDYRLSFAVVEPSSDDARVQARGAPQHTPSVPLSAAFGWTDDPALPPPPPLLDASEPATPVSPRAPAEPSGSTQIEPPRGGPESWTPAPERGPAPDLEDGFVFDPNRPEPLVEQVFAAVWSRVADDVLVAKPGTDHRVARLLDRALAVASSLGTIPPGAREQLAEEMLTSRPLLSLLKGEPDEVVVLGTQGIRADRGGHVSTGPSPFSCASAVVALGSRLCGVRIDAQHPVAHRACGPHVVLAVHGSSAGGTPTLALRKAAPRIPGTLEELESLGAVAPPHAELLRAAMRGGLRIVLCAGPGASARPVLGALLASAPATELHVVVAAAGADARGLRAGTVLLTREHAFPQVVEAALRLRPARLALEDVPWSDGAALDVLTASSLRVVASVRAAGPDAALPMLCAMLEARGAVHPAARSYVAMGTDLWVTLVAGRDGVPRVTAITELYVQPTGDVEPLVLASFDPERGSWSGVTPSPRLDELVHRGLLDPRVLQPQETMEDEG